MPVCMKEHWDFKELRGCLDETEEEDIWGAMEQEMSTCEYSVNKSNQVL